MLKKILVAIIVLIGLCASFTLGTYWYYSYFFTAQPPQPILMIEGSEIKPVSYTWRSSFAGGLLYKDVEYSQTDKPTDLGVIYGSLTDAQLETDDDREGVLDVSVTDDKGILIWNGFDFNFPDDMITRNGLYRINANLTYPEAKEGNFGAFTFAASFVAYFEPKITTSNSVVAQGNVFVVRVYEIQEDSDLSIDAGFDTDGTPIIAVFTPTDDSSVEAIIGVTHDRPVGEYHVLVSCDDREWDLVYTVVAGTFERQNLTVDTSDPQITEANSPAAYEQFRAKIYPLYETADPERYWSGEFIRPVDWEASGNRISTTYGIFRYTNNNPTPRRHPAMDIAAPSGTTVLAPNNGRVVFAEYLLNTGNTLVIEYGGGLKSYFYHLSAIDVKPDDMVTKGQKVAEVGSTGYSTGPHLHYELRVGRQSLNPMPLSDGSSELFFLER